MSQPAPVYFDSGAPPPAIPLLTAHTEIVSKHHIVLLCRQPLLLSLDRGFSEIAALSSRSTPPPQASSSRSTSTFRERVAAPRVGVPVTEIPISRAQGSSSRADKAPPSTEKRVSFAPTLEHNRDCTDDDLSDGASVMSADSSLTDLESIGASMKIPKPEGEAGRPGRGGYNLASQLAWDSAVFTKLKVRYCTKDKEVCSDCSYRNAFIDWSKLT